MQVKWIRLPFEPEMIPVPGGPFLMGTSNHQIDLLAEQVDQARAWRTKGHFRREQPQHVVALTDYDIGRHPVTVGQYRSFVGAGGYESRQYWAASGWAWRVAQRRTEPVHWPDEQWTGDDRLPVVGASWYEACAYCRWLATATGRGCRLPTEAEWEKAARGADGRLYPWGETFDARHCNTAASALDRTTPTGQYSPQGDSPYGCAGMVGNVSEWTLSAFRPYPYHSEDGREDPEGDTERATRGGSWHSPVLRARAAARGTNHPWFADNDVGFRCVSPWPNEKRAGRQHANP